MHQVVLSSSPSYPRRPVFTLNSDLVQLFGQSPTRNEPSNADWKRDRCSGTQVVLNAMLPFWSAGDRRFGSRLQLDGPDSLSTRRRAPKCSSLDQRQATRFIS